MALKIMMVDDDPHVLRLLSELLRDSGFVISSFTDSRDAAATAGKEKFDAVFLDAQMPYLNGFELVRRIRVTPSNALVPVVMLTGYDDPDTMRRGFDEGVTYFLGKPITPKKLRALLVGLKGSALREKRRYARVSLRTSVSCASGSKKFQSVSLNISQSGMLLNQSGGLEPSDLVHLEFSLPEISGKVTLLAEVIRTDQAGNMAVCFRNVGREQETRIQDYVIKNVNI